MAYVSWCSYATSRVEAFVDGVSWSEIQDEDREQTSFQLSDARQDLLVGIRKRQRAQLRDHGTLKFSVRRRATPFTHGMTCTSFRSIHVC